MIIPFDSPALEVNVAKRTAIRAANQDASSHRVRAFYIMGFLKSGLDANLFVDVWASYCKGGPETMATRLKGFNCEEE